MSSDRVAAITLVIFSMAVAVGCSARHSQTRAVTPPPAFAEKIDVPGVSDFGKVNDFLYRGAQPKDDGVEQLKNFGIDTIVDLRGEFHGLVENERQRVRRLVASAGDPGDAVIPLLTFLAPEYGTLGRGVPRPLGSISQARILSPNTCSAIASACSLESSCSFPCDDRLV